MTAPSVVKAECDCGTLMSVKKNAGGGYSLHCSSCKSTTWKKTPKAVAAFEKKHGIAAEAPAPADTPPAKSGSFLDNL